MIYSILILFLLWEPDTPPAQFGALYPRRDLITIDPEEWLHYGRDGCIHGFEHLSEQYPFLLQWYVREIYYLNFKGINSRVNSGSFYDCSIDAASNWA